MQRGMLNESDPALPSYVDPPTHTLNLHMQWVVRVSLSDWLALWARNRGSKDPRLLRDRSVERAAWAA